ncbi:MAG: T9SS type A sorting domain-containing protein [Bacteroidia bacterium]|nr:T9SS type A sorting domain-containing protein [Bacteroidia bacterium]
MIIKNIYFLIFFNLILQTAICQVRIIDLRLKVLSPIPNSYIKSPGVIDLKFSIFNKDIDSIYKSDTLVCYFTTSDSHFKYRYIYFSKNIAPYDSEIFISKLPFNSKKDYNYWNVSASCQVHNRSKFIQNETVSQQNDNGSSFFLKHRSATSNINSIKNDNFGLFPNPADDKVYFNFNENINKIVIYDISGKIVKDISDKSIIKNGNFLTKELINGLYYLKIFTNKKIATYKLLINHL